MNAPYLARYWERLANTILTVAIVSQVDLMPSAAQTRIVALSSAEAAGTTGTFEPGFGAPVINELGQTAFYASTTGQNGFWSEEGNLLSVVAQKTTVVRFVVKCKNRTHGYSRPLHKRTGD